jgi:glycosyltransferase involved in cell wall biosynthesis
MKIGIMLRAIDEKGGVGVYTRYITQELLEIDRQNQYVLFYRRAENLGRFSHHANVVERVVRAPNKALWDQVAIPYACWREGIDVVFHPKFTVPLLAPCKTVMVLHGAGWLMPETSKFWNSLDLRYVRAMMPVYCQRASAVLAVSQITTDTFNQVFALPSGKIRTVYFGPGKQFRPVRDRETLARVRTKYGLPEHFILTLSGYDRGQRKNIDGVFAAYKLHHGKTPHKLVVGGKGCAQFRADYQLDSEPCGQDVVFPGWIDQEDLPAVYSLAALYLYPSFSEAFPIPLTEALTCGTPIVTSNLNGLREIAGDAAVLVDAGNPGEIAAAMDRILGDRQLRDTLVARGFERAQRFTWERCGRETLGILQRVGGPA